MEEEVHRYRRSATRDGRTLSEWVRQKQRRAARAEPSGSINRKPARRASSPAAPFAAQPTLLAVCTVPRRRLPAAIRAAARHDFPTGDIDRMLREIESGHRT